MPDPIICPCLNIPKSEILAAIAEGCDTLDKIKHKTGAGTATDCALKNPQGISCAGAITGLLWQPGCAANCCA